MKQFKIGEDGYKKFRQRWLRIMVPFIVVLVLIFVAYNLYTSGGAAGDTWLYFAPIVPIIYIFSIVRSLKKQKKFLLSYTINISDNEIMREQMNTPPLTINFMEIKEIIRSEKGNFIIKGASRTDIINIPYFMDNIGDLEQHLQTLAPIKIRTKDPWHVKYRWALLFLMLALFLGLVNSNNKVIVGICGTLSVGLIIWAIYFLLTSKNIPTSSKRRVWIYFLILASIIYATYTKLTGTPLLN